MKKTSLPFLFTIIAGVLSSALPVHAQSVWNSVSGVNANTNWSTAANWTPVGVPGAASNVLFIDLGSVSTTGIINNVVDTSLTVQQLIYRQTNGVHNTLILPGVTLTISNAVAATNFLAGTESTASPTTLMVTNTISGAGGTLAITSTNLGSVINVRQITSGAAGSHLEVLDISGLDTFNASIGNFYVGVFPGTTTARPQGAFFLAKTNRITVLAVGTKTTPSLDVGDTGGSPDANNLLALGMSNSIAADTIEIGNQRSGSSLKFNPVFTNSGTPSVLLRGHSNSRVTTFNVGDNSSATANIGSVTTGVVDFSGGKVDALIGSMTLGDGQPITGSGAGTATGTLTMGAGIININTLEVGFQNNVGVTAANTGTVNVNGGTLAVNTSLRLAFYGGSGGLTRGTLNLAAGSVQANTIVAGGGTSTINLTGGTLIVSNTIGSLVAPLSALTVNGGATLQLAVTSGSVPVETTALSGDNTGVINVSALPAIASYPSQLLPLIVYQNGNGSGVSFSVGTLPSTFTGYISNDNSSTVFLVITNGPNLASVTWTGNVNNLWDTNTLNWKNAGSAAKYRDPDVITFDDSAAASNVNVTATFAPAAWVLNNSNLNYTFTGAGNLTGTSGLIMNGSGSVTLAESGGDNFSGGILVNAGRVVLDDAKCAISGGLTIATGATLQIGNGDTNGILPSGSLDDQGVLFFDRTDNLLVSSGIPGAGSLIQNGSGTLILSAANTYSGNTTVNAGTLALIGAGSISNTPQVTVSSAKLDVSGLSGTATLSSLNLVNATLTVAAGSPQTNLVVNNLTMGGSSNIINVTSLPAIASYPATITLVQSQNSISGFNLTVGSLPGTSVGTVTQSADGTAIVLNLTNGPIGVRPSVTWVGLDALRNVNTNWSDRANWQLPGPPMAVDNVIFNNTATSPNGSALSSPGGGINALTPANFDNIVDSNFTIASLTFTNGGGSYHNTGINAGETLSITNFFNVGAYDSVSALQQEYVTISGTNATLDVNNANSSIQVWVGASGAATSQATLDLSALDNFSANVSRLAVGACAVNNAVNRPSGVLYLAKTNTISCAFQATATETGSTTGNSGIVLGDCNQNAGPLSSIYLGQSNVISADTIGIARQKASANVSFNPIYANTAPYPSVVFKGFTSGLVSTFDVGAGVGNTGTTAGTGTLDLTGGIVTLNADTINLGRASSGTSGSGLTTGNLDFDAGTITANTFNVGFQPVTGAKAGSGTLVVNSNSTIGLAAQAIVNGSLNLGVNVGDTGAGATTGTLTINGGTVQAGSIVAGTNGAQSTINLNAGSLIVLNVAGTTNAPISALNLGDGTVLQLNVMGSANAPSLAVNNLSPSSHTSLKIGSLSGVTTNVTYPLISYGGSDPFSSLTLSLPSGYAGTLVDGTGVIGLTLTTAAPPAQPAHITAISVSGTTLHITATNGVDGGRFVLLGSTNITLPLSQWTRILTNNFDGAGKLNLTTNIINPAVPQEFYNLSQ